MLFVRLHYFRRNLVNSTDFSNQDQSNTTIPIEGLKRLKMDQNSDEPATKELEPYNLPHVRPL